MPSSDPAPDPVPDTVPDLPRKGSMRFLAGAGAVMFVVVVGLLAVFSMGDEATSADGDLGLSDFEFATPEGGSVTLADYEGEPVVLNFFAAWCAPCRAELPDFEEVHQERAGTITFLGVSRDTDQSPWLTLIEESGVTYDTVYEGTVRGSYEAVGAIAMPTTVFIDADGNVVEVFSGPLSKKHLNELIDEHLL